MYLLIDLAIDVVELAEPGDLKRLHAAVAHGSSVAEVERLLTEGGVGHLVDGDDEHVWVATSWLRHHAEGRVSGGWFDDFDAMITKARQHGWLDEAGTHLRAHVEWLTTEEES